MTTRVCDHCGGEFQGRALKKPSCCSDRCRGLRNFYRDQKHKQQQNAAYKKANRARCSERERLRKAKIEPGHPQYVERVDRGIVYRAHGGCCGICKEFVEENDFEVDHTVPLSQGGLHGYINTAPSHPSCNRRKYNKVTI